MEELTGLDARFLYSETPTGHMHTLKIVVFDLSRRDTDLTATEFVERMRARLDRMPILRRRVVTVPYRLGHPVWVEDPDFDLNRHLSWRVAPSPGSDRELAAVIADVAAVQLPRDRPLWELTVVDGLEGGRVAFVVKMHHSLADGGAAVALLENAFAVDDEAHAEPAHPEPLPTDRDLIVQALRSGAERTRDLPRFVRASVHGALAARQAAKATALDLPVPFSAPRTSLNASLGADRTFAMTTMPLDDLLAAKRAASVTLNDVFLAVCGGALRRYLGRHGPLPRRDLVAGVPVATSGGARHLSGNHVDNLMLPVGTDIADPVQRVQSIHAAVLAARDVREALGTDLFEYRATLTPPMLYPFGIRLWARTHLADRTRRTPGVRIFRAADGEESTAVPIDVGLPPFEIVFLE
jgi:diacylglycerol O-acyltransferase